MCALLVLSIWYGRTGQTIRCLFYYSSSNTTLANLQEIFPTVIHINLAKSFKRAFGPCKEVSNRKDWQNLDSFILWDAMQKHSDFDYSIESLSMYLIILFQKKMNHL